MERHARLLGVFAAISLGAAAQGCSLVSGLDSVSYTSSSASSGGQGASAGTGGGSGGTGGASSSTGGATGGGGTSGGTGGTGAAGGTGGAGATGGAGGTGGVGGSTGGDEDCQNGVDDDGDGAVDCDDPDCGAQGFSCVTVPEGWNGPVVAQRSGDPDKLAACPSGYPKDGYTGSADLKFNPASCSACSCTSGKPYCNFGALHAYSDQLCAVSLNATYDAAMGNNCALASIFAPKAFKLDPATVTIQSGCAPSGGQANTTAATWTNVTTLCGGAKVGVCSQDASQVCAPPAAAAPFEAGVCIWQVGDNMCPKGFANRYVAGSGLTKDERGCTPCACDNKFTCDTTYRLYANNTCLNSPLEKVPGDGSCFVGSGDKDIKSYNVLYSTSGSCPPSGGAPTGAVVPVDPITVCCVK